MKRLSLALALTAASIGSTACGDPTSLRATALNVADTLVAYALTGTPPFLPTAYSSVNQRVTRAEGDFQYDIAFDINAAGRVVIYPVQLIGGAYAAGRGVGIQKLSVAFDALERAPTSGYQSDSALVLATGEGIVMQASSSFCPFSFNPIVYTKLAVDAVNAGQRTVEFHVVHNPNCGFRSFAAGLPPN